MVCRRLALLILCLASVGCRTTDKLGQLSDIEGQDITFQIPECLPHCTAADQQRLAATSTIEAKLVSSIQSARTTIDFSMYTFSRKPIFEALIAAARRGVRIRGIMDRAQFKTTATFCKPGGCTFSAPYSGEAWVNASIDQRLAQLNNEPLYRDGTNTDKLALLLHLPDGIRPVPGSDRLVHNKYLVVDNQTLYSGSGNWSSTAVSVNLENLMQFERSTSPEVLDGIQCSFEWFWRGDPNTISQNIVACEKPDHLYLSPAPRPDRGPQTRILDAINNSQSSIAIAMHHLADPEVFGALVAARQRGVAVKLAVDDDDCNATPSNNLRELLQAGAEIRYLPTNCSIFQLSHSKYGIFDQELVINGSANWSKAGLKKNYENFVVVRSATGVGAFRDNFERLWTLGVTESECRCDPSAVECQQKYCLSGQQ